MIDQTLGGTPLASESISGTTTLSGSWASGVAGSVAARGDTKPLVGVSATGALGIAAVRVDDAATETGSSATGALGSFGLRITDTFAGGSATGALGLAAVRVDDFVTLTGVNTTGAVGVTYEQGGHAVVGVSATSVFGVFGVQTTVRTFGVNAAGAVGVVPYEYGEHGLVGAIATGALGSPYEYGEHAISGVFAATFAAVLLGPLAGGYATGNLGAVADTPVTITSPGAMAWGYVGPVSSGTTAGTVGCFATTFVSTTANQLKSMVTGEAFAVGTVTRPLPRVEIVCCEGFDHQSSISDLSNGILAQYGVTSVVVSNTQTPFGVGNALMVTVGAPAGYVVYQNGVPTANALVCGVMTQSTAAISAGTDVGFVNNGVPQLFCRLIGSNILVCLGPPAAPTIIATAVRVLPASGWVFIEVSATFASTATGSVTVQVDGQPVLNLDNLITSSDGTNIANGILLGGRPSINPYLFDDLYVALTLLGPMRVNTIFPVANVTTQFVPSANTNYQQIAEPATDGDASYNFDGTVGQADSFVMGNLAVTVTQVMAVKVIIATRSDAESIRTIQTTLQSNLAIVGGSVQTLSNTYVYFNDVFLRDPNTKAPWTPAGVRAARMGYKIVS
jgi:hypothetical protein